jgi:hypothetical protein
MEGYSPPVTDFGPPPIRFGAQTAVAVDIQRIEAGLAFDVAEEEARADAAVDFVVGPDKGCPMLDLRQPIDAVVLDGEALPTAAFGHRDLGGGPRAEMRVLERVLPAGSRHRLELAYRLETPDAPESRPIEWLDGGVRFDLWMSDLHPGRYLEMWLPSNLCHDRFQLTLEISVAGATADHAVLSNGVGHAVGPGRTRLDYPGHFTSWRSGGARSSWPDGWTRSAWSPPAISMPTPTWPPAKTTSPGGWLTRPSATARGFTATASRR